MTIQSKAIIDTCILLDALIINFIKTEITDENDPRRRELELMVFDNDAIYEKKYRAFLEEITTFVTSSQAIGELQGLSNSRLKLKDKKKIIFWRISAKFLELKNLDEHLIKLLATTANPQNSNYVFDIGFVDASLIDLARETKLPIITNDAKTLAARAFNQPGVDVFVPKYNFCRD